MGRYVALLAGLRGGRLVPRASFFQLGHVRAAQRAGVPLQVIAHEDVLVLRRRQGDGDLEQPPPEHESTAADAAEAIVPGPGAR